MSTIILLLQLLRCSAFLLAVVPVFVLLIGVCRLKSAAMLRAIWGGVLLVSLFAFAIPVAVPVAQMPAMFTPLSPEKSHESQTDNAVSSPIMPQQMVHQKPSTMPFVASMSDIGTVDAMPLQEQATQPSTFAAAQAWIAQHWKMLLIAVWIVGVLVLIVRRFVLHAMLTVRLFRQIKPTDGTTRELWESLFKRHVFRSRKIPVRLTDSTGPAIIRSGFGFVLLIPETLWDELSPELRIGVLRHELGHLVHHDTLLSPLAYVLATLQWFNPAAWYALKQYNKATEWHADEFAYATPGNSTQDSGSSQLAETFLAIHRSTESLGLYLHSFSRFSTLDRVNRLVHLEQSGKEHAMKKLLVGAIALTLLLAGVFRIEFTARAEMENDAISENVTLESPATTDATETEETPTPEPDYETPFDVQLYSESFAKHVAEVEKVVRENHGMAVFGRVLDADGNPVERVDFHVSSRCGEGMMSMSNFPCGTWDGWFGTFNIISHPIMQMIERNGIPEEFKTAKFFVYTATSRPAMVELPVALGKIYYVTIVLEKTPEDELVSFSGTVLDEENQPIEEAMVFLRAMGGNGATAGLKETKSDGKGRFTFDQIASQAYQIAISKVQDGYLYEQYPVIPEEELDADHQFVLHKQRAVEIEYVYQPDGSRDFTTGDLESKTVTLESDFGRGFRFETGEMTNQARDVDFRSMFGKMQFSQVYFTQNGNGFYHAGEMSFESMTAADENPETYRAMPFPQVLPVELNHVYVVKTVDGKYVKFIVRKIIVK